MEERLVLNKEHFRAINADARIKILKILKEKQQTLTDLASQLDLTIPTVKEHLEILEKTKLINKIEDGRKWKYYTLSEDGKELLNPNSKGITLMLSVSVISFVLGISMFLFNTLGSLSSQAMQEVSYGQNKVAETSSSFLWIPIIFILVSLILFIIYLIMKLRQKPKQKATFLNL